MSDVFPPEIPPALQPELCRSDQPLALLPVRLETRFFPLGGLMELRIRVYPDKIHLDSHEELLTAHERQWGEHFWTESWSAADDGARAWQQLAERFGAPRASWIARTLRPVNPHERPSVPPRFPEIALAENDASWRRAPLARLLPDRWIAVAYVNGRLAGVGTGRDIAKPLAAGPHPDVAVSATNDRPAIDDAIAWMVDFDAAEVKGMALRLPLHPSTAATGIETLLVFGVATKLSAAEGASQLAQMIDAHHYTDGFGFLRLGAPSNNTAEVRSAYTTNDAGQRRSFAEFSAAPATADRDSNASRLARAAGFTATDAANVLGNVWNAALRHDLDARSMNNALWPATWGYFLRNMIGTDGTGVSEKSIAWTRGHFLDHVRGGGPFPAIRCGRQPYGILPVTSLDMWRHNGDPTTRRQAEGLRRTLLQLRDLVWRPRLGDAPRVAGDDPDADLARVMRTDGVSHRYHARALLGRHYLTHLRAFLLQDIFADGWVKAHDRIAEGVLHRLDVRGRLRLARATYADLAWPITSPLVQAGEVSATRPLEPNFITALLAATRIDDIVQQQPTTLLHALLRHALLLEYAGAAAAIVGGDPNVLLRDEELVDLVTGSPPTRTWRKQLLEVVPNVTGAKKVGVFLEGLTSFELPAVALLGAFREGLARLQTLDSESLQLLMQSGLDLATHRLDAWITSFATMRLSAMRAAQAEPGLYIGGYGWVEDLRAEGATRVGVTPPAGEEGELFAAPNDPGFVHAPSMDHAATAALLRNAHLGHGGQADPNSPFAIDLSSRRVREAKQLLDGVRQGQPLGALLGYRFERRLHDLHMDEFIDDFRAIAPLTGDPRGSGQPQESIAANNVVDGLALSEKWRHNGTRLLANMRVPQPGPGKAFRDLKRELDALGETIDAVSDALTAESAYQVVRGNVSRIASNLASLTRGEAAIPELEVARTPRSGTALTHRTAVLFSGDAPPVRGWAGAALSPRAAAEPMLNAWAARLLGDPRKIVCRLADDAGAIVELHLGDLQLSALDVVYGTDLEQRVLYAAERKFISANASLRIVRARPQGDAGAVVLHDLLHQARAVRRLLAATRALDANDLDLPERGDSGTTDLAELETRIANALKALQAALLFASTVLRRGENADAEALRTAILRASSLGLDNAIPTIATGDDVETRAALRAQLVTLAKELQSRIERVSALQAQPPAERMQAIFGAGFVVLPRFSSARAAELTNAFAATVTLQDGDPLAVVTWFERARRVRENLSRLGGTLRNAEVLAAGERQQLTVAQLPHTTPDRWIGLPMTSDAPLPSARLSLVVQSSAALHFGGALSGLLIDEWVEVIPHRSETTALAFQYNPPNAMAPQAVLLAVPPVPGNPWIGWDLHRVLLETLDLAKLRALDPESLGEVSHYLPALHFAFNADNDAVSTDFGPLT